MNRWIDKMNRGTRAVEMVGLGLGLIAIVACADDHAIRQTPPAHHPPAALDMRGDCMTPPCGPQPAPLPR
ncbi:MAG: hypothetical protein ICV76_00795 [Nitrospiraceae bacterium]|nr:hypothetical protein [Nitrospiraceae bacterium]